MVDVQCYCFKIHIIIKRHVYMSLINSLSGKNIIYLKKGFLFVWLSFKVCDCSVIFFSTRYIQKCSWKTRTNKNDNLWKFVIACTSMNMSCFVKKSLKKLSFIPVIQHYLRLSCKLMTHLMFSNYFNLLLQISINKMKTWKLMT